MNDFRGTKIGSHVVECVELLDNETCLLTFGNEKDETDKDIDLSIQVEYWIDEEIFVFNDCYYDTEGNFLDYENEKYLTDEEKQKCMDIITEYLKPINVEVMRKIINTTE